MSPQKTNFPTKFPHNLPWLRPFLISTLIATPFILTLPGCATHTKEIPAARSDATVIGVEAVVLVLPGNFDPGADYQWTAGDAYGSIAFAGQPAAHNVLMQAVELTPEQADALLHNAENNPDTVVDRLQRQRGLDGVTLYLSRPLPQAPTTMPAHKHTPVVTTVPTSMVSISPPTGKEVAGTEPAVIPGTKPIADWPVEIAVSPSEGSVPGTVRLMVDAVSLGDALIAAPLPDLTPPIQQAITTTTEPSSTTTPGDIAATQPASEAGQALPAAYQIPSGGALALRGITIALETDNGITRLPGQNVIILLRSRILRENGVAIPRPEHWTPRQDIPINPATQP